MIVGSIRIQRSEVNRQLWRLHWLHDIDLRSVDLERALGHPLVEGSLDELRGIIAALTAVADRPPTGQAA